MREMVFILRVKLYFIILLILLSFPFGIASASNSSDEAISILFNQVDTIENSLLNIEENKSCKNIFWRGLEINDQGSDVYFLQKILNTNPDYYVSNDGVGSVGNETDFFGIKTQRAVISFQEKFYKNILLPVGKVNGTGYVGDFTRLKLEEECESHDVFGNFILQIKEQIIRIKNSLISKVNNVYNKEEIKLEKENIDKFPVHTNITAAVFWIGEPVGNGSSEDNAISAWDDDWQNRFGGFDDPLNRNGYHPKGFTPKENPFYLDLPYNDFDENGNRKLNVYDIIPWSKDRKWEEGESMMKNRWVKITYDSNVCFGQIQDAGPYLYDDSNYVFGHNDEQPESKRANGAGMDISPALRDCLGFIGWNNVDNKVDWQFVDDIDVPDGPWKEIITTSQINWPQ